MSEMQWLRNIYTLLKIYCTLLSKQPSDFSMHINVHLTPDKCAADSVTLR